ncbi:MAG: hypothetical protein Q4C70_00260, partial [Planctomycetia bacterium]|nr:hypothetical protein [Planctomycetia bacterium]
MRQISKLVMLFASVAVIFAAVNSQAAVRRAIYRAPKACDQVREDNIKTIPACCSAVQANAAAAEAAPAA